MKYSTIGYILGQVLKFEGIFMLLPFLTGMIYHENEAYSYLIIGIICFVLGCLITLKKVKHPQIFNREGFVAVALSWIVLSIFGAIPFVITGEIPSYVDARFCSAALLQALWTPCLRRSPVLPRPAQVFSRTWRHSHTQV